MPVIALDWGTSRMRAYLLDDDGSIRARRADGPGAIGLDASGFAHALQASIGDWALANPQAPLIACGMVGARGAWVEAGYLDLPASLDSIRHALVAIPTAFGRPLQVVAGLRSAEPDVIRGEETQALGTGVRDGLLCMPGTHSKWVRLRAGAITAFQTWFTGELFELLNAHGSVAKALQGGEAGDSLDSRAFAQGVEDSRDPGLWLHQLFGFRARVVGAGGLPSQERARLSGWLIGTELRQALVWERRLAGQDEPGEAAALQLAQARLFVGDAGLSAFYRQALELIEPAGAPFLTADPDCAARGLWRIATGRL